MGPLLNCAYAKRVAKRVPFQEEISDDTISYSTPAFISAASFAWYRRLLCYDRGSDFPARLLTGYDYGTPQVSFHISHGQSSQSAE